MPEPALDEIVDGGGGEQFGEEELAFVGTAQIAERLVAQAEQFFAGNGVLEVLDPVHHVQLVLLAQRAERPSFGPWSPAPAAPKACW